MNHRLTGPLDPLIEKMPNKLASELAKAVSVSRNTVLRWQKDPKSISLGHRLMLQLVQKQYGLKLDILNVPAPRPSDRYTCSGCGENGHRVTYCPSLIAQGFTNIRRAKGKKKKR